ncbi:MAG: hypothetical protein RL637_1432 [Pseudomonadota bacterium]
MNYPITQIRADFPILRQKIRQKPLIYFDNAASTQKPESVIETLADFYRNHYANIHRGVHTLSQRATDYYELSREKVKQFIHAKSEKEIVFVRGATEAINLVAQTWGKSQLKAGDQILISAMEHHANIVPWQLLCQQIGTELKIIPMNSLGELIEQEFDALLTDQVKFLAITQMSNALGTINPIKTMIAKAHNKNIPVLIDGAQAIAHLPINVEELDCDFYVFSGHKIYAPSGIGVLYGKQQLLELMPPYQGGGDMIRTVNFNTSTYAELPYKFEAGTPSIADTVALGAAIDYVTELGMNQIANYEQQLLEYAIHKAKQIPAMNIIGQAKEKGAILSFTLKGIHPHDIGTLLDSQGIAIRAGHHCAMPVMDFFQVPATARASFAIYNTIEEIDYFMQAIEELIAIFG